jgi:hypothetical protein
MDVLEFDSIIEFDAVGVVVRDAIDARSPDVCDDVV